MAVARVCRRPKDDLRDMRATVLAWCKRGWCAAGWASATFATIDLMPTFAELCGFQLPEDRRIDGIDQTDLLLGKRDAGRDHFYFDRAGVRQGKWKYLKPGAHFFNYAVEDDRQMVEELYDLESDLGEQTNLATEFPRKVTELRALMRSIEGPVQPAVPKKK